MPETAIDEHRNFSGREDHVGAYLLFPDNKRSIDTIPESEPVQRPPYFELRNGAAAAI